MRLKRAIIYTKDIQRITGKSERSARRMLQRIKKHYDKQKHQLITQEEFSEFSGLDLEIVGRYL
ncbi:hypothetical protein N9L20_07435 [Flavobacteriaceae bacterium]|nr:hypothetical protein [Flavobacteriaceae bacterium]